MTRIATTAIVTNEYYYKNRSGITFTEVLIVVESGGGVDNINTPDLQNVE
jgi:hypothetical protein